MVIGTVSIVIGTAVLLEQRTFYIYNADGGGMKY